MTRIGQGGMAEVYRAEDLRISQPVALKFLTGDLAHSPTAIARLHQEVRLARQIAHPNVCRVFDIGDAEGQPFLIMEYIDGEDLAGLLRRIGRLPIDKGLEIAQQLCGGLTAIHDSGILHRDLKPANVLIDARGRARITDFGISVLTEELHRERRRMGTPAYMAPEQLAGGEVTVRSDLYALGLILYEMLTGCRAFEGASLQKPTGRREGRNPIAPSMLVREIDARTEMALLQCLEPEPAERPASALHLAAMLPGPDPLAAAAVSGESPVAAMAITSFKVGSLRPAVAATLLGIAVLFSMALLLSARDSRIVNRLKLDQPPVIMAHRARDILSNLGYTQPPSAWAYWYAYLTEGVAYQKSLLISGRLQEAQNFNQSRAPYIVFVYRESPRPLAPRGPVISGSDPPITNPGEALVWLDPEGRLRRLVVVPDQRLGSHLPTHPDWRPLFEAASLDPRKLTAAEPQSIPPGAVDVLAAWRGTVQVSPRTSIPFRVEAGSYRGAPVYFEISEEYPESMIR
ncbi:MAG TPA: serine/threonine-protein kinase, partial [Gemmatimonadales bacterium]|nr:serine/threonine-protein kinase [Gemmatimonadales bacterium]